MDDGNEIQRPRETGSRLGAIESHDSFFLKKTAPDDDDADILQNRLLGPTIIPKPSWLDKLVYMCVCVYACVCVCMRVCLVHLNAPLSHSLCIFQVVKTGIAQGAQVGYEAEAAVSSHLRQQEIFFKLCLTANNTVSLITLHALIFYFIFVCYIYNYYFLFLLGRYVQFFFGVSLILRLYHG